MKRGSKNFSERKKYMYLVAIRRIALYFRPSPGSEPGQESSSFMSSSFSRGGGRTASSFHQTNWILTLARPSLVLAACKKGYLTQMTGIYQSPRQIDTSPNDCNNCNRWRAWRSGVCGGRKRSANFLQSLVENAFPFFFLRLVSPLFLSAEMPKVHLIYVRCKLSTSQRFRFDSRGHHPHRYRTHTDTPPTNTYKYYTHGPRTKETTTESDAEPKVGVKTKIP